MIDMRLACVWCDADLPDDRHAVRREFCSQACYKKDYRRLEREGRIEALRDRPPCGWCGTAIAPERDPRTRYCDLVCRYNAYNDRVATAKLHVQQLDSNQASVENDDL